MARLTSLSENANMDFKAEFVDLQKMMSAVNREDGGGVVVEDLDNSRHSSGSVNVDELSDAQSTRSSRNQGLQDTSVPLTVSQNKLAAIGRNSQVIRRRRSAIQKQFASLEASNYIVDATVVVENPLKSGGQRFKHISTEITKYYPSRVKLDTGSEADMVSLAYLLQAGFDMDKLQSIPEAQQAQVVGIDGAKYTPEFEVELTWFRQREACTNKGRFLVVEEAPFDILLSSNQFAVEAARQLVSLPLVRPRKSRGK